MIENKYVHYKTKNAFDTALKSGIIDPNSIVYIDDVGQIWTHNVFFSSSIVLLEKILHEDFQYSDNLASESEKTTAAKYSLQSTFYQVDGDAKQDDPYNVATLTLNSATQDTAGLMSALDKTKVDNLSYASNNDIDSIFFHPDDFEDWEAMH